MGPERVEGAFECVGFQQETDIHFLVVVLRWLRTAAVAAQKVSPDGRLARSLDNFDRDLPSLKDMRDIGEHMDDYLRGGGPTSTPRGRTCERAHPRRTTLRENEDGSLTFTWAGGQLDLDTALSAAERLYAAIRATRPRGA